MKNSQIMICKNIKLDKGYKNVLSYTENEMLTLCNSKKVASDNKYSFIKPGKNEIDVNFSYNDCLKCNYMAFQNPYYSNKWFFAFIDSVEYRSDSATRINFTIDEYATWFDYWNPSPCFIIREHIENDVAGANTQPEGLETGEYVIRGHEKVTELCSKRCVLATPIDMSDMSLTYGDVYNGIFSSVHYYSYDYSGLISAFLAIDRASKLSSIASMFIAPSFLCTEYGTGTPTNGKIPASQQPIELRKNIDPITTIGSYTPKNKKILTYPYIAINVSNAQGSNAIYQQELFTLSPDGKLRFQIECCITPGCSIRQYPIYYKGEAIPYDESITLGKYPTLNWTGDPYTNWLTQNSVNDAVDIGGGLLKMVGGIGLAMTGVGSAVLVGGLIASGGMDIFESAKEHYEHSLVPPQARGNLNSGDVMTANYENTFHYYKMTVKEEFARSLDDYFDKYGYKTNRIKQPNQTSRPYWNYVQIGKSENIGYSTNTNMSVPDNSMEIINTIYRNGVTLWHDHDNLGNYGLNNH